MKKVLVIAASLTAMAALAPSTALAVPDGGYFAIGLGGAFASGDRGVRLEAGRVVDAASGTDGYKEIVRTDFASGMAVDLRFGYLIAGVVAPEISLMGHGNLDFESGAGYPSFNLRYHPVQHFIDHEARSWDANVYVGAGFAIGGYAPDPKIDDDSKGWRGWALHLGFGGSYQIGDSVSLVLDVRFALPQYGTFLIDWDDDIEAAPQSTPSTLVTIPTLQAQFHF